MSEPTSGADTRDEDLLAELADEFLRRHRAGERPTVEEYAQQHPGLAGQVRDTFPAMLALEQPPPGETLDPAPEAERLGGTIGRYKLLERIGEGGFGVVYMAEQHHPVRRRVALKVVKPGMDSRQVLARFEAERQALAIMDHPNIAKVFDGGMTESGRPYFVMELVKGEPITAYCDRNQLPPRQRLELFAQVCHAVQHAHQKGIIHRDIKPTNVLVALHDTQPVVKVIDFGIAKALGQELTDKTLFTGFAQLIGTPLYMSPEQAGHSALDVDTRSDIYSLGVLLYELLTGSTPFDKERFRQAAHDEIRRIIREEEPPRPSTRLSESKDRLPSISAQRHTEPAKLARLVRGELDWIVMKALEKDRNRRYETANGFAADVQRYLADEPVLACPPSAAYRLKKFARRNKATLVTASVICVALLFAGGSFGWTVRDRTARHARVAGQVELILAEVEQLEREQKWPEALAAARRAEAVLATGEADAATALRVRERLTDHEFVDRLERARLLQATWAGRRFDYAAADRAYAEAFRDYGVDVDQLAVSASVQRLTARPQFAIPFAAALDDWAAGRRGMDADAADWARLVAVAQGVDPDPVRDRLRATWGRPSTESADELLRLAESVDLRAQHPVTIMRLAEFLRGANRPDAALKVLRDAQTLQPADFWLSYDLAHQLAERKDYDAAVRFYTAAVAIRPHAAAALNDLGNALRDQKKPDEAIGIYRRAIEIDPELAYGYNGLAGALRDLGKPDEAVATLREGLRIDPEYADACLSLGIVLCDDLRQYDKAIECFRKAIELQPKNPVCYQNLAVALHGQEKLDESLDANRKAFGVDPTNAESRRRLALALNNRGWSLSTDPDPRKRDPARAVKLAKEAVELEPNAGIYAHTLGVTLCRAGDWEGAIAALETSMDLREGGDALEWFFLAMAQWQLGNREEARRWYDRAVAWMDKNASNDAELTRFRAEAAELLNVVSAEDPPAPSTAPAASKSRSPEK